MAIKVIEESELKQLLSDIENAEHDIMNRDKACEEIFNKFERNLVLIGATAVEDRL